MNPRENGRIKVIRERSITNGSILDDKHLRSISPHAQGINYLKRSGELQLGLNHVKLGKVYAKQPPSSNAG